ncbi:T9SS type A sorting domain-containing protein [Ulvibacter antarcticus]|uniref:Putative secreted protein (Por secretion system target) n=1 Tax=Ulvibacter antarcticus TaxID=442714 RepID=A0A3L9ZHP8_9FLAO|nr:T9SS type A sorting domain-containing protein [Ulvibacter antarcticus]RMA66232.1 putative secreted protein (Por secretion system target) [Ulvibacter antarcticus]
MKKLLLLLICILISVQTFAQNPEIYEDWHLHNLIINGENHIPNHLAQALICTFRNEVGVDYFYFPNDNYIEAFLVDYAPSNDTFILLFYIAYQLGICSNQACLDFFVIYSPFYYSYAETEMNYEIIHNSNDSKTLIVTNIDGDQAIYNTEPLVLSIDENSLVTFIVFPNPVSETLFITSENLPIENLTVYNLSGQTVLIENQKVEELNVSSLSAGLYFIEITSEVGKQIQKFVKH